jgi:DNA-binding CsgD family transcriptional regulator
VSDVRGEPAPSGRCTWLPPGYGRTSVAAEEFRRATPFTLPSVRDTAFSPASLDGPTSDGPLLALLRVLADELDGNAFASVLVDTLLREYKPVQLTAYFLDPTGTYLEERAHHGDGPHGSGMAQIPLEVRAPVTEVWRDGQAAAWTMREAAEQFPAVTGWARRQPARADEDLYVVPIRNRRAVTGVVQLSLPAGTERSWRLRLMLDATSTSLAVWARSALPLPAPLSGHRRQTVALSPRQQSIVDGIRRGRSNRELAVQLHVSVGTIKADLAPLYQMFGTSDRAALPGLVDASRSAAPHGPNGSPRPF